MNVRFFAGTKEQYLKLTKYNPLALYFCADTKELYWADRCLSDGIRVIPTKNDLPELSQAADGIVYYIAETHNGYTLSPDRTEWFQTIYAPAPDAYEVPESEIYKTVTTVGAVRKIENDLRTKIAEVEAKIDNGQGSGNNQEVNLEDYYTKAEVAELIAAAIAELELPDFSEFITEIPAEYITEDELNKKGYLTEHQSLDNYAKKEDLFNKDYNELVNKPEIPSIEGLATEGFVAEAIRNIPKVDLSEYATKAELPSLDGYAKESDIPSIEGLASETYVNDKVAAVKVPTKVSELENDSKYLTAQDLIGKADKEHNHSYNDLTDKPEIPSIDGLATEQFVRDEIAGIDIPEVDTSNFVTTEALNTAFAVKADNIPFTTNRYVQNATGNFAVGDNVNGLTVAEILTKLLGLSDDVVEPDEPEGIVETIMFNKTPMHQINDNDIMVEVPYVLNSYSEQDASFVNDGITGFYTVTNEEGTRVEAGYQHFSTQKEPYYIIALPEELEVTETGNVTLQTWDTTVTPNKWTDAVYVLTSDYDEIVATYNIDGITPPVAPEGYRLWADLSTNDPGTSYRFIIKE